MSAISPHMEQQRHELLSDVADLVAVVLEDHGVDVALAEQCGAALADRLATHWGGQLINIPKDYRFNLANRDLLIYEEFTGNNHGELARKYGMTVRGIYKIIERARKRDLDYRQPKLF